VLVKTIDQHRISQFILSVFINNYFNPNVRCSSYITRNGLAMNSTGHAVCEAAGELARWQLSAIHIAKSFCFVFSFPSLKQNPKDFADFIKIHKPFD